MLFDSERVWLNARQAATEDLLDRITVYRNGMEPEALEIVEAELHSRGIGPIDIETHVHKRANTIQLPDGTAQPCSFCHRPAVFQDWGWYWLLELVPLFPRYYSYCELHRPPEAATSADSPRPPE